MFLTLGPLPFERLWDLFFQGHEGKFSVYIHASQEKTVYETQYFIDRDIRSDKVEWGQISMVDAEKRLLANALEDPHNQNFVLLSERCVPLHNFDYVYNYLIDTNISFIDSFVDPGPHGNARYTDYMLPEIRLEDFRKGSQWFTMKRKHAIIVMADNLYYAKFGNYCRPGFDGRNCYSDEHYLPTFFHKIDPTGMSNWSVTHVDWSEHKWHPKSYTAEDVTFELLQNLTSIDETMHETSEEMMESPKETLTSIMHTSEKVRSSIIMACNLVLQMAGVNKKLGLQGSRGEYVIYGRGAAGAYGLSGGACS